MLGNGRPRSHPGGALLQCPLWVRSRRHETSVVGPLFPKKQTSRDKRSWSAVPQEADVWPEARQVEDGLGANVGCLRLAVFPSEPGSPRHDEPRIQVVEQGRPWSFDGDGGLFRLVSEAQRIRLACLFDPVLAVHTSIVEPLPHQITAVYEVKLPRRPLRFLLADDPDAGKTIMAGLDEGTDRSRRPSALPRCLSRQPSRTVAGRALSPLSSSL
jgi:hypothetical protein